MRQRKGSRWPKKLNTHSTLNSRRPKNSESGWRDCTRSGDHHTTQPAIPLATKISDQATVEMVSGEIGDGLRTTAGHVFTGGTVNAGPGELGAWRLSTRT